MDRTTAESLMASIDQLGRALNDTAAVIELIADSEERKAFRRGVGEMMCDSYGKLMRPILHQYPDLDPDK